MKNIDFMQHNIKMQHVLGWSIKKCGSFLKYVVLVSKTVATSTNGCIFNMQNCSTTVLADGKISLVLVEELVKIFCSNYWQNPHITVAVNYFHYNSHHHYHYHHFHYHCACERLFVCVCMCVCVCVCVFVCVVCTSILREGFICLDQLECQGTHQRCYVEDVSFLSQVLGNSLH